MARVPAVSEAPAARSTTTARNVWDPDVVPARGDIEARNEMLVRHQPLVRYVAKRVAQSFGVPSGYDMGDLVSYGMLGLIEAHERFEADRGVTFETFAVPRIRGAIIDELRRSDWVPRNVRARARRFNEAAGVLAAQFGRTPTRDEVAARLGIDEIDAYERNSTPATLLALEDIVRTDASGDTSSVSDALVDPDAELPGSAIEAAEVRGALVEAMADLPERDRLILTLYYFEGVPLGEISKLLKVTESRVSQLHTRALNTLYGRLRDL